MENLKFVKGDHHLGIYNDIPGKAPVGVEIHLDLDEGGNLERLDCTLGMGIENPTEGLTDVDMLSAIDLYKENLEQVSKHTLEELDILSRFIKGLELTGDLDEAYFPSEGDHNLYFYFSQESEAAIFRFWGNLETPDKEEKK